MFACMSPKTCSMSLNTNGASMAMTDCPFFGKLTNVKSSASTKEASMVSPQSQVFGLGRWRLNIVPFGADLVRSMRTSWQAAQARGLPSCTGASPRLARYIDMVARACAMLRPLLRTCATGYHVPSAETMPPVATEEYLDLHDDS